jgi:uncharacterized OsmC-like protein
MDDQEFTLNLTLRDNYQFETIFDDERMGTLRVNVEGMETEVRGRLVRNEKGRLRVAGIEARLVTAVPPEDQPRIARCLEIFEDFCIVSGSVRKGVDIAVEVDVVNPSGTVTA